MDREERIHKEKVNLLGKYEINLRTNFFFFYFSLLLLLLLFPLPPVFCVRIHSGSRRALERRVRRAVVNAYVFDENK